MAASNNPARQRWQTGKIYSHTAHFLLFTRQSPTSTRMLYAELGAVAHPWRGGQFRWQRSVWSFTLNEGNAHRAGSTTICWDVYQQIEPSNGSI